jgi:hypothetical protein
MSNQHPAASLFTQVDITPTAGNQKAGYAGLGDEHSILLSQILAAQDRQNELMEELVNLLGTMHKQRQSELQQWKKTNPDTAKACRSAAEALGKVHVEFLNKLTEEVTTNWDDLMDGEFVLNEFVDRFGPRLAHLGGVLQVLSHLGAGKQPEES